jgi:hypothetical protein
MKQNRVRDLVTPVKRLTYAYAGHCRILPRNLPIPCGWLCTASNFGHALGYGQIGSPVTLYTSFESLHLDRYLQVPRLRRGWSCPKDEIVLMKGDVLCWST